MPFDTSINQLPKYFNEGSDNKLVLGSAAQYFFLEFHQGKLAIKTEKGRYVKPDANGGWLSATSENATLAELYDF